MTPTSSGPVAPPSGNMSVYELGSTTSSRKQPSLPTTETHIASHGTSFSIRRSTSGEGMGHPGVGSIVISVRRAACCASVRVSVGMAQSLLPLRRC
jgi:hypothetical protein